MQSLSLWAIHEGRNRKGVRKFVLLWNKLCVSSNDGRGSGRLERWILWFVDGGAVGYKRTHLAAAGNVFSVFITFFFFGSFSLMASTSSSVPYRLSAHPACNHSPLLLLLPDVGRSQSLSSRSIHLIAFFRISSNVGVGMIGLVLLLVLLLSTVPSDVLNKS